MPQLDIATFAPQLFWLAVSFLLLYILMATLGLPMVKAAIEGRRHRRESDLSQAAALKLEAEAALTAYHNSLSNARTSAQETLRQTTARMAAEAAERQRELAAALATQIAAAEQRIAASKEQALADIRGVAAELGGAMVEKLTGVAPPAARMSAAVDEALAGRGA